ncbi:MAG: YlxR family protein [Actinomycetota bacterium]|nr:MAG: YlxR family protein [Actinomycetota bacterium]
MRCALGPAGTVSVQRGAPGRGAWLCIGSRECFEQALKRRGFERAWHKPVQEGTLDALRVTLGMSDVRDQLPELQVVGHRRPAEAMKD